MKKKNPREYIRYWFDRVMSKGPIAMSILLLAVTTAIVVVIGVIAYFVSDDGGLVFQLWNSLMHTLDAGMLADNATDNVLYVFLMFLATLCGLCLTSVLISIISTGVENKLSALRKGTSVVQEENHTVVIGFDDNVYTLLRELIEANANHKRNCIVLLGEQEKEEMEDALTAHIPHTKTTDIICRSGQLHELYALGLCSVERAKSVIVNVHDDADTVKVLLALSAYLKDKTLLHPDLKIVAYLQEGQCFEAGKAAGEGRALILSIKDTIARIIANTCRQHGLSQVLTELFNFGGHEMYIERVPALEGKTFREALMSFANATVVGLCDAEGAHLNPPMDTVIGKGDSVVIIEEDDGAYQHHAARTVDTNRIRNTSATAAQVSDNLIVLGSNNKLPVILEEYDKYVRPNTKVTVVDTELTSAGLGHYANLDITLREEPVTRRLLYSFMESETTNLLLLNDDSMDPEPSDSQTLLRLILLRDIADRTQHPFTITTEMRNTNNQRLATRARVDDFVIGTDFISLLMAQISEDPRIKTLIDDLLDEDGSELYLKPATNYVPVDEEVDGYLLTAAAAAKGEVYVGYRRHSDRATFINPHKETPIRLDEKDMIVVISER